MDKLWAVSVGGALLVVSSLTAADLVVTSSSEIRTALASAEPGDRILIAPGTYSGGFFQAGLTGVTLRSQDPNNLAVIQGGTTGIQLSDATDVTIEHLVFEGAAANGINIDDGGSFQSPSSRIILRELVVRNVGTDGNHDGIKLSGVTEFLIDRVQVTNWGRGGSAVDPVGSHHGLIQNSWFRHSTLSDNGSVLRPKGGSKKITMRANRIDVPNGAGRAIQAGGSTGSPYFRFDDGDCCYEADQIVAEGNVILGGSSAFNFVNIDGGVFHHNYAQRPGDWAVRILNENRESAIVDTQNGKIHDNVIVFNDTASEYRRAINVGEETLPASFSFARNRWYNLADPTPAGSTPSLPVGEQDGVYGVDPNVDANGPIVWTFDWGAWVVNANDQSTTLDLTELPGLIAHPGEGAKFDPLTELPVTGDWTFSVPGHPSLGLGPFSQAILIDSAACPACRPLPGDYDGSGMVDDADRLVWQQQFGQSGLLAADGNLDARVDAADYTIWRDHLGQSWAPPPAVPFAVVPEVTGWANLISGVASLVITRFVLQERVKGIEPS